MLQNHIDAVIDGKKYRLTVRRENVAILDGLLGGSCFAALKRFQGGEWTAREVELVLSFALRGPTKLERMIAALNAHLAAADHGARRVDPAITAAVRKNGHGTYADLAATVLVAALFGITEADAKWSDSSEAADAAA